MAIALSVSNNQTPGQNHHYLNAWPGVMMEDLWHFNQCAGIGAPVQTANDKGGTIYLQTEREYIARHLESAAGRMALDLNYWINPAYFSETIKLGKGRPFYNQIHQARFCKMIALGKRATMLIQAAAAVTYSDPNTIGVNDTATITISTTIANSEIRLYFQTTDGAPTAGDYRYEIEPTVITDDGAGTVTIKAHRSLFVKPTEWARQYQANDPNFNSPNVVNTLTTAGFVTAVDVYRVYTDTSANIELLSNDGSLIQNYSGEIIAPELSAFRMTAPCSDTYCGDRPTQIRVSYYAGSPLVNGYIDSELFEAAAAYAAGSMQSTLSKMSYWSLTNWIAYHAPMVEKVQGAVVPVATKAQSDSQYGARTGQVMAWDVVTNRRIMKAHKFF